MFNRKLKIITTSDPNNASFRLYFRGNVDAFADIKPDRAVLAGQLGNDIKTEITITPNKKQPFKILETKAQVGKNIRLELKETSTSDGPQYLLTVVNTGSVQGPYNDVINIKTDNKYHPEMQISVAGDIK